MKKIITLYILLILILCSCKNSLQVNNLKKNENIQKVHFSIDDVNLSFKDLTKNSQEYNSLFDQSFFAYLKNLHDKYNIVISLYCFYENNNFSLSECTAKFATDFNNSAEWLKLCFHAYNPEVLNIAIQNNEKGYEMFVKEIFRITGSYENLITTARLERFKGTQDQLESISYLQNAYGIKQFLTADSDSRDSYYLNESQKKILNQQEKLSDEKFDFFKTDFRFDDFENFNLLYAENCSENELIVFTHEWLLCPELCENVFRYNDFKYKEEKIKKNIETFLECISKQNIEYVSSF